MKIQPINIEVRLNLIGSKEIIKVKNSGPRRNEYYNVRNDDEKSLLVVVKGTPEFIDIAEIPDGMEHL